eukprot:31416-Pelagococcus_subviridis.AAC.6
MLLGEYRTSNFPTPNGGRSTLFGEKEKFARLSQLRSSKTSSSSGFSMDTVVESNSPTAADIFGSLIGFASSGVRSSSNANSPSRASRNVTKPWLLPINNGEYAKSYAPSLRGLSLNSSLPNTPCPSCVTLNSAGKSVGFDSGIFTVTACRVATSMAMTSSLGGGVA